MKILYLIIQEETLFFDNISTIKTNKNDSSDEDIIFRRPNNESLVEETMSNSFDTVPMNQPQVKENNLFIEDNPMVKPIKSEYSNESIPIINNTTSQIFNPNTGRYVKYGGNVHKSLIRLGLVDNVLNISMDTNYSKSKKKK
jgi:hypothetical protein